MWFSLLSRLPPWLSLVLAVAALAALAASTFGTWAEARRQAASAAERSAWQVVQSVARDQERLIESASQLIGGLAERAEIQARNAVACGVLFAGLLKKFPQYLDLVAIEPSGEIVCAGRSPDVAANLVDSAGARSGLATGNVVLGPYTIDRASGKAMISLFAPAIDDAGEVRTIVAVGLDVTWLARTLIETPLAGASLTIVDRNGVILAHHPAPDTWVGKLLDEPVEKGDPGPGRRHDPGTGTGWSPRGSSSSLRSCATPSAPVTRPRSSRSPRPRSSVTPTGSSRRMSPDGGSSDSCCSLPPASGSIC